MLDEVSELVPVALDAEPVGQAEGNLTAGLVRDAGGLVLSASNAKELNQTLDSLISGKILVE